MSRYSALLQDMMDTVLAGDPASATFAAPGSQVGVYVEGYRLRLQKVLEGAYPALLYYMGKAAFDAAVLRYIAAHPSRHFNLDRYPIGFAASLALAEAPAREIAMLESAIAEVYLAEESPCLAPQWSARQSPETLSGKALRLRAAARLLACEYSVEGYLSAFRDGAALAAPVRRGQYILVVRHCHQVRRHILAEGEYTLLRLLACGHSLDDALDNAAMCSYTCDPAFATTLARWFARWAQEGFLRQPEG